MWFPARPTVSIMLTRQTNKAVRMSVVIDEKQVALKWVPRVAFRYVDGVYSFTRWFIEKEKIHHWVDMPALR